MLLRNAGSIDFIAIRNGVDIDLDRVLQIAVEQYRAAAETTNGAADAGD